MYSLNGLNRTREKITYSSIDYPRNEISREKISEDRNIRLPEREKDNRELDSTWDAKERTEYTYEKLYGQKHQFYFAHSFSKALKKGGRVGFHMGGILELNHINYERWSKRPSYRVYTGMDLDLSKKYKLLAEMLYDPDFVSIVNPERKLAMDIGLMYAWTDKFRFLVHLQVPFIGLYWRF